MLEDLGEMEVEACDKRELPCLGKAKFCQVNKHILKFLRVTQHKVSGAAIS